MWTIEYKESYIHGYFDKDIVKIWLKDGETVSDRLPSKEYKSIHAAKIAITRFLNKNKIEG